MDYSRRLDEKSFEEVIKSLTKVIKKDDGNEYTYIGGVCVSINGEETDAGKIYRLGDIVLEGDADFDYNIETDGPPVERIRNSDLLLLDAEEKKPLKNRTPRFQLFTTKLHFDKHRKYKPYFLSGHFTIFNRFVKAASEDEVVSLPPYDFDPSLPAYGDGDAWIPHDDPEYGVSIVFYRPLDDPIRFLNTRLLEPLPTHCPIPVYNTFLDIIVNLYAISRDPDDDDNVFYQIKNEPKDFNLPIQKYDTFCQHKIKGHDGHLDFIYIVLTDPVDAALEITFHPDFDIYGKLFDVQLVAYYGDDYGLGLKWNPLGFQYSVVLLEADSYALLNKGKITLNRSFLAVPAHGTLRIKALINEIQEDIMFFSKEFDFPVNYEGSTNVRKEGKGCSLEVNVNWNCVEEEKILIHDVDLKTGVDLVLEDQAEIQNDQELLNMQTETDDPLEAHHPHLQLQQVTGDTGDDPEHGRMVLDEGESKVEKTT